MTAGSTVYFPSLNGFRFVAAFSVLVQHVVQFEEQFGNHDVGIAHRFFMTGYQAVLAFFVLSGFLITYLLLAELAATRSIQVRKFYVRRVLRIWPLYYLVVAVSFGLVPVLLHPGPTAWPPPAHPGLSLLLFLLFVPNLAEPVLGAAHAWSIGVEEQFYLAWPVLLRRLAPRLPWVMGVIILAKLAILTAFEVAFALGSRGPVFMQMWQFSFRLSLESMALGALGAYLVFHRKTRVLRVVFHPLTQASAGLALVALVAFTEQLLAPVQPATNVLVSLVFAVLIVNAACNPRSWLTLETRWLGYLGRISYGIYMYHPLVIVATLLALRAAGWAHGAGHTLALYVVAAGATIGVSALSHRYFEMPCLELKRRFAVVESSDEAAASARFPRGGGRPGVETENVADSRP